MGDFREYTRIHLNTAIVVTIVASGVLWLNLIPQEGKGKCDTPVTYDYPYTYSFQSAFFLDGRQTGSLEFNLELISNHDGETVYAIYLPLEGWYSLIRPSDVKRYTWWPLFQNVGVLLMLLFAVSRLCERLLKRGQGT
jgi:hypothetical protein